MDGEHGLAQLLAARALGEVAGGAGRDGVEQRLALSLAVMTIVRTPGSSARMRSSSAPAELGHVQVEEDDVGAQVVRQLQALAAVGGLADDVRSRGRASARRRRLRGRAGSPRRAGHGCSGRSGPDRGVPPSSSRARPVRQGPLHEAAAGPAWRPLCSPHRLPRLEWLGTRPRHYKTYKRYSGYRGKSTLGVRTSLRIGGAAHASATRSRGRPAADGTCQPDVSREPLGPCLSGRPLGRAAGGAERLPFDLDDRVRRDVCAPGGGDDGVRRKGLRTGSRCRGDRRSGTRTASGRPLRR